MLTRTIKTTEVEYKVFNRETDDVETGVAELIGTFSDEDEIVKALKNHISDSEIVLKVKVTDVTTQKYGMSLEQFIATATKLD